MLERKRTFKKKGVPMGPPLATMEGEIGWGSIPAEINMVIFSFLKDDPKLLCILDQVASWLRPFCSLEEFWLSIVSSNYEWTGLLAFPPSLTYSSAPPPRLLTLIRGFSWKQMVGGLHMKHEWNEPNKPGRGLKGLLGLGKKKKPKAPPTDVRSKQVNW